MLDIARLVWLLPLFPPLASTPTSPDNRGAVLMPLPAQAAFPGGTLAINSPLTVGIDDNNDPAVRRAAERFAKNIRAYGAADFRLVFVEDSERAHLRIRCKETCDPASTTASDESYTLSVGETQIALDAATTLGALRGLATLEQLSHIDEDRTAFEHAKITDRPRFPWRGLLIDVCRHWQPMPVIKRNIDAMAAVKLNVLHLHLTEDQGFRVESKIFPELHRNGSDGKYFSQDELREIVAYAHDRGIRVVPEFDMPGHTASWLVGKPELAAGTGPFEIVRKWGVFDQCFDPTSENLYEFLEAFFGEMATLFPDPFVHIGGDEVNGRAWNGNPRIQSFMQKNNLPDNAALQAYFIQRVAQILARHGKKMIGWDEILHAEVPDGSMVQSWRGLDSLRDGASRGFDMILSNGFYLDHQMPASFHYANDPGRATENLDKEARSRVLGGEACMWGEYVSQETIDSRIWPRLAAIAERLWSPESVDDVDDMYRRLEAVSRQLDKLGVQHRANYEPMLKRLAGNGDVKPLKVLADIVEPVKLYQRSAARAYTSSTPLDRLVDAARPESDSARAFSALAARFLASRKNGGSEPLAIRRHFEIWRDNHESIMQVIGQSPTLAEIEPLSLNLRDVSVLGLRALDLLESKQLPDPSWHSNALKTLAAAEKPLAEVTLAVIPGIRALVDTAGKQQ